MGTVVENLKIIVEVKCLNCLKPVEIADIQTSHNTFMVVLKPHICEEVDAEAIKAMSGIA